MCDQSQLAASPQLEVLGGGFGRTGTYSLFTALNKLGYKCHHMAVVARTPRQAAAWLRVARTRAAAAPSAASAPSPDPLLSPALSSALSSALDGHNAAVDWPSVGFFRELLAANPAAKVVLTTRDFDAWYESVLRTIFARCEVRRAVRPPFYLAPLYRERNDARNMVYGVIWDGTFEGRFTDKEHVRQVYERHLSEVRRLVPAGQLLEFDVRQGWGPLCAFLGKPMPPDDEPFPKTNAMAEFEASIEKVRDDNRRLGRLFAACNAVVGVAAAVVVAAAARAVTSARSRGR